MKTMPVSPENVESAVSRICSKYPDIVAAYLFGSFVADRGRPPRDVDLALLLDDKSAGDFPLPSFITEMEKNLKFPVDVVVLNRAGEVLKFEVRRTGRVVFERSAEARIRFEVKGRKTYEDFLYYHNKYFEKVVLGARCGQPHPD